MRWICNAVVICSGHHGQCKMAILAGMHGSCQTDRYSPDTLEICISLDMPQCATFMCSNVISFVAFNFVLGFVFRSTMDVPLVIEVACMNSNDLAGNPARFAIPANMVALFEFRCHLACSLCFHITPVMNELPSSWHTADANNANRSPTRIRIELI